MVWLVINGTSSLYGSETEGLKALSDTLAHRRGIGCTIVPDGTPTFGMEYKVQHPADGFELIYLSDSEPEPQD